MRHAEQIKADSETLAVKAADLVERYGVGVVLVETNQGGNLWKQVFKDLKARVRFLNQKVKKEVRIAQSADYYKKKMIVHTAHFPQLEEQMLAYPNVVHDDLVDAVATAAIYFDKGKGGRVTATQIRYKEA